jgi:hypothetical protein
MYKAWTASGVSQSAWVDDVLVVALVAPWGVRMFAAIVSRGPRVRRTTFIRAAAKLTSAGVLDERERQPLVVVEVIENPVVRVTKRGVRRALESTHED